MKTLVTFALFVFGGMLVSPLVLAGELYISPGAAGSGGTINISGAIPSRTIAYSGKVRKTTADGRVIHGSVEAGLVSGSNTLNVTLWLSGVGPSETLTSVSSGTDGSWSSTTVSFQMKKVSFRGKLNRDTGRGFIRRLWTDAQTGQTVAKPGGEKIPVYLIGGHLFGKFEDEDGSSMSFHARVH